MKYKLILVLLALVSVMWAKDKTELLPGKCEDHVKQARMIVSDRNWHAGYDAELGVLEIVPGAPGVGKQVMTLGYSGLFAGKTGRMKFKQEGEQCVISMRGGPAEKVWKDLKK